MQNQFTTHDWRFLKAIGSSGEMTPAEYQDANKHRDITPCRGCRAQTFTQHASDCRHAAIAHVCWLADDWMESQRSEIVFTKSDRVFLHAVGIDPDSAVVVSRPDGTVKILERLGIPVTRGNYLRLAFAGNPPEEPLDGEIEAQIPRELRTNQEESDADED